MFRLVVVFFIGLVLGTYFLKPFLPFSKEEWMLQWQIEDREDQLLSPDEIRYRYFETQNRYKNFDPSSALSISNTGDLNNAYQKLKNIIWENGQSPTTFPKIKKIPLQPMHFASNIWDVKMSHGIDSKIHHFKAKGESKNWLICIASDSERAAEPCQQHAEMVTSANIHLLGISLPLQGNNSQPMLSVGKEMIQLTMHDQLKFLSYPLQYFITPVEEAINQIYREEYDINEATEMKQFPGLKIGIFGMESGGWVATLAAAVNTRITHSYPVSASYPLFLRSGEERDWGDFEETYPPLVTQLGYLDLYLMGSAGKGRKQKQFILKYNDCCFSGTKSETYTPLLRSKSAELLGEFDLVLDDKMVNKTIPTRITKAIVNDFLSSH